MEPFLTATHVTKRYANHLALDDASIAVPRGKIFGLLGPNGAGKTTLIRILNRITAPDSGEVRFDGHPLAAQDVARIGYLPEERGLYKKMKVGEQAIYFAQLKGLTHREARERLTYWFQKFGIMPWWNRKLEELSKGMAQKVQFIITVLHEPDLLIFDEPFSGFDPVNVEQLKHEILALKEQGRTIIFSTHNMGSVEEICDEIALVNGGRVVLSGDVAGVKGNFRTGLYEVVATGVPEAAAADALRGDEAYQVVSAESLGDATRYIVRKAPDLSNSDLARRIADRVELRSFAEQMPTMNDIFLKVVGSTSASVPAADNQVPNNPPQ